MRRDWTPVQPYWITRKGSKMMAMPAWVQARRGALWSVVVVVLVLPQTGRALSHANGIAFWGMRWRRSADRGCGGGRPGARPHRPAAVCVCRMIPGIVGPDPHTEQPAPCDGTALGPFAGILPNTPDNMQRWLRAPHVIGTCTAMPAPGLTPEHAVDITAFLARFE